jgi:hypothetical protein
MLVRYYLQHTNLMDAEKAATEWRRRFPENSMLIRLHAESLIATKQYQAAVDLLASANLLPAEGATQAHSLYREACLQLSLERMKAGQFQPALDLIAKAQSWPENLGVGAPYAMDIDDRLEDWLSLQCYRGLGLQKETQQLLATLALQLWPKTGDPKTAMPRPLQETNAGAIVHAMALKEYGRAEDAQKLLAQWRKDNVDSELAKWGEAVLADRFSALPFESQDDTARVLSAWLGQKNSL